MRIELPPPAKRVSPMLPIVLNMMRDMPRFVKPIEKGLFDVKSMITATYPLERPMDAIQAVADRTTLAAIVTFS